MSIPCTSVLELLIVWRILLVSRSDRRGFFLEVPFRFERNQPVLVTEIFLNGEMSGAFPMIHGLRESVVIAVTQRRDAVAAGQQRQLGQPTNDAPALTRLCESETSLLRVPEMVGAVHIRSITAMNPHAEHHSFQWL